jgi:hypothetical protein|tara:strand:+ start:13719 stop:14177 length:459 start_codon:yes stop_codon:yes gene_type:complete
MPRYVMTIGNSDGDVSLAVGDTIWAYAGSTIANVNVTEDSGLENYSYSNQTPYTIGKVRRIGPIGAVIDTATNEVIEPALLTGQIEIQRDAAAFSDDFLANLSAGFAGFHKSSLVNTSGIKGYYAEVTFRTNTHIGVSELFSVGAEVVESSK